MKRKSILSPYALIAVFIGALLLVSMGGCMAEGSNQSFQNNTAHISSSPAMYRYLDSYRYHYTRLFLRAEADIPDATGLKKLEQYAYASGSKLNYIRMMTIPNRLESSMAAAVKIMQDMTVNAVDNISSIASSFNSNLNNPVTDITATILTNDKVMDFIGIRSCLDISGKAGTANVYIIENDGYLARIMNSVISLFGYSKAGGGTLYPFGIFIMEDELYLGRFYRVELHEYCHYYQQSVMGLASWLRFYAGEIALKYLSTGDIAASYDNCSWEVAADQWAESVIFC